MRAYALPIVLLCAACPSDDDSMGDGDTGVMTMSMTMPSTMTTTPTGSGSESGQMTTTEPDPTTGDPTTDPETSATTTGNNGDLVWLQNDSVDPDDPQLLWQAWPGINDCWGASYDIPNDLYPFDIVEVEMAIGGSDDTQTFRVGVWNVNNQNEPTEEIDSAEFDIQGNVGFEPHVDVSGLNVPTIESGSFAIVVCHTGHMGAPSIGTDMDGNVDGSNNWVYQGFMGEWVSAPDFFGIDGDFIVRAGVRAAG